MTKNLLDNLDEASLMLVRQIGVVAQGLNMKAYLVGGPVRDLLLKCPSLDLDITVEGKGIDVAKAFAAVHKAALKIYPAFGTATVTLLDGRCVDFVSARKESYVRPGAFPKVIFSSIKDDLFRRDFTVNAIAIGINPKMWGKLVDPFGGVKDIKAKKIRVLHPKSFIDDPTRIVRAVRFKCRLDFSLERGTLVLLRQALHQGSLDTITLPRYLKEYNKIMKEENLKPALAYLASLGGVKQ